MRTLQDLQSLKGKVVLITGGAGYLGQGMSEVLAELGAVVIIGSRDKDKSQAFCEELKKRFAVSSEAVRLDITSLESIDVAFSHIEEKYGRLDVLVNNGWSGNKNTFESINDADWSNDINVCLNGPFRTVKRAFPLLKKTQGVIINTASMYGVVAPDYRIYDGEKFANPPSYGAAKAAVIQLTKYLASFLSPYQIRVNSISPGACPFGTTLENEEFIKKLSEKSMLNRIGVPEDMKGIIAFLCSDASSFVTGQNISIDGGWTSW